MAAKRNASNMDVKRLNRNKVFRYVNRHERLSKPEIAAALGMSAPTVLMLTKELQERGVIKEEGEFASTGGRKAKAILPMHDVYYAVGLDITQNHISLVLTNLSGKVLQHVRIQKVFAYTQAYLLEVSGQLLDFVEEAKVPRERVLGVGVSIPGIVDAAANRIVVSHMLSIDNVDCDDFSRYIPYPCTFINDANAAAFAERYCDGEAYTSVYLSLSNSVGGALVMQQYAGLESAIAGPGQVVGLYDGDHWRGGEIGHMTLVPGGKQCYCGQVGCFDAYCTAKVLARHTGGKLEQFFARLETGEAALVKEWNTYLDNLAVMINTLRMLMDCRVILGGYVGGFMEPYLDDLRARVSALNTFGEDAGYVQACHYRIEASALGAALQPIEAFVSSV